MHGAEEEVTAAHLSGPPVDGARPARIPHAPQHEPTARPAARVDHYAVWLVTGDEDGAKRGVTRWRGSFFAPFLQQNGVAEIRGPQSSQNFLALGQGPSFRHDERSRK